MSAEAPQPPNVNIRTAGPGDLPRIQQITREVFAPASIDAKIEQRCGRPAESWHVLKGQAVAREIEANPEGAFVAEIDGVVAGYVTTNIFPAASRGQIANLATAAEFHSRGLGRRLIERALEHFRSLGLKQAKIETLADNAAGNHLYPRLGFEEIARQVHFVMELQPAADREA